MSHDVIADHWREHTACLARVEALLPLIDDLARLVCRTFEAGGTLYAFGNGGSACDAMHLVGELAGHYRLDRPALPAVVLGVDPALTTCIANDYAFADVFVRPLSSLVRPHDLVWGFSTSGRSPNVRAALDVAAARGAATVLATGDHPEEFPYAIVLRAPAAATARIQEVHTLVVHMVSDVVDRWAETGPAGRAGENCYERLILPPRPGSMANVATMTH